MTDTDVRAPRPFRWSVRRELWENRSVVLGPPIAATVVLVGCLLGADHLPREMRGLLALDASERGLRLAGPYAIAALAVMLTSVLVGLVYCLGALHNERRDRSILFWKSLPVSDRTTVLAKITVPLIVLPLVAAGTIVLLHLTILLLSTAALLADGVTAAPLWTDLPLPRLDLALLYGLATLTLWYAPVYLWLLLVSGWARRVVFLWAALPPLALAFVEHVAFRSSVIARVLADRLWGSIPASFDDLPQPNRDVDGMPRPEIAGFLATPGLWVGLAVAALFAAATVWLRRRRDPI